MRAAVISMQTLMDARDDPIAARESEAVREEAHHALAIALALKEAGHEAWLLCHPQCPLPQAAIPRLILRERDLRAFFRLWRWQRYQGDMLIIAVGQGSLRSALRLKSLGKKYRRRVLAAYFITPPGKEDAKLLGSVDQCLCGSEFISNHVNEILAEVKTRPELLHVSPGMNLALYPASPHAWTKGRHFVFGMADSLMPQSGALLAVRAMSALWQNDDIPPWEVRMFGGGPRYAEVMEEATNLGVLSRLAVLGDQPLGEVSAHCDVWLAPGIAPDELPPTLWAGFGAGLPVICTKSWLHKERVWDRTAVLRVGPENPQEMARAMLGLMRDGPLRNKLGNAAWAMRQKISLEAMTGRVCQLLEESERPPRGTKARKGEE